MKQKTQYTIEMDSHLSAKAWRLLSESFEITVLKRSLSLDSQDIYWRNARTASSTPLRAIPATAAARSSIPWDTMKSLGMVSLPFSRVYKIGSEWRKTEPFASFTYLRYAN